MLFIKFSEAFVLFERLAFVFSDFCWGNARADVEDEEFVEDEDAEVRATITDGCWISFKLELATIDVGTVVSRVGVKVSVVWDVWLFLKFDV